MNILIDAFEFKWKFVIGRLSNFFVPVNKSALSGSIYFTTHEGTKEWILGAKAKRLSKAMSSDSKVIYSKKFDGLPMSKGYYFLHQNYFAKALKRNAFLFNKDVKSVVMFTHPSFTKAFSKRHIAYVFKYAYRVICLNADMKQKLMEYGVDESKILVWHLASNPDFFSPKKKVKGKTVGLSMAYYERKNPDLMYNIINYLPEVDFCLIGQNWDAYPKMKELTRLPNFTYHNNVDYDKYPELYQKMDVFLSTSKLEGGPVPLLESMLMDVVPVVSKTGFCPDIVKHNENGYLFDIDAGHETVSDLILKAIKSNFKVRNSVVDFSWDKFGEKLDVLYM